MQEEYMSALKPLKVGIVGAGGIANALHIPNFRRCEDVDVVAVCDVNDAAVQQTLQKHGIQRQCREYRDLLAMDDLDIISICTSNDMHHAVGMAAMDRGFDVFCEKPLAMTVAEARELCETARAKGTRTGVNFSHRRTPACYLAKELIESGALGKIHYISAVYAAGGTGYAEHPGTWRNDRLKAGYGGLGDMGAHIIDMMLWWLGSEITAVTGQSRTIVPQRVARDTGKPMSVTTEDHGTILVSYANGALGYFCGSYVFTGRGYDQRAEVYGSEGGLMYNQQRPYELDVFLSADLLKQYEVLRQGGTRDAPYTTIHVPERLQGLLPGQQGVVRSVIMDYIDAYRAPGPFRFSPGFYEGLRVQEVLEASRLGEEQGRWIKLPLA
jgi:predicted dehydrogenase